jgi:hypothetical protein
MPAGSSVLLPPPASVFMGGGGSGWVPLIRANGDIDAHLLTGRLLEAGVESRTVTDRSSPGAWLLAGSNPWAPVTILVRRLQLEDARIVLAEISFGLPDAVDVVDEPRPRRWSGPLLWWAVALALGAIFTGIGLLQTASWMDHCKAHSTCAGPGAGDR